MSFVNDALEVSKDFSYFFYMASLVHECHSFLFSCLGKSVISLFYCSQANERNTLFTANIPEGLDLGQIPSIVWFLIGLKTTPWVHVPF